MTERQSDEKGDREMELEAALRFVEGNHRAVLATHRRDGTVQMSPILAGVDDGGQVVISSNEDRAKTKNLRRDPRASLCVLRDTFFGGHVQIDGTAEILSLPEAMEPLVDYYRRLAGEHPSWDEYRRAMRDERRCLIRITVQRAVG
jgi:PPOX class probable F420-dependent enzyme